MKNITKYLIKYIDYHSGLIRGPKRIVEKIKMFSELYRVKRYINTADIHDILEDFSCIAELFEKCYFKSDQWAEKFNPPLSYMCFADSSTYMHIGSTEVKLTKCLFSFKTRDDEYGYYIEGNTYIPDVTVAKELLSEDEIKRLSAIDFYVNICTLETKDETGFRYAIYSAYNKTPNYSIKYLACNLHPSVIELTLKLLRDCMFNTVIAMKNYIANQELNK